MRKILAKIGMLFILLSLSLQANAQLLPKAGASKTTEKSDPEATKILKQLREKYEKYVGIHSDYILTIDNRETKEKQSGKITQKGDKFHVENDGNQIFCDGKTLWMYMKKNHEVQINEYEKDDDPMSPNRILKIYEAQDQFMYAITNENGTKCDIEFKPLDKEADFSKIRIEVDRSKLEINYIKVFAKDGTIYTFEVKAIKNINPEDAVFKFNKTAFPGVKEVDMR